MTADAASKQRAWRGTRTRVALGADASAIGRAYLYGLMAGGEPGVNRALDILAAQFKRTMQLLGVRSVAELRAAGPDLITRGARA